MLAPSPWYDLILAHATITLALLKREDTHNTFLEPNDWLRFSTAYTRLVRGLSLKGWHPPNHIRHHFFFSARRGSNFFISGDMHWVAGFRASSTHHFSIVDMAHISFTFIILGSR